MTLATLSNELRDGLCRTVTEEQFDELLKEFGDRLQFMKAPGERIIAWLSDAPKATP